MRKYTKIAADKFGVQGYVSNTESGTVRGECCGSKSSVEKFKKWLSTEGSPKAKIERAEFSNEHYVDNSPFNGKFQVRKVIFANGKQWAD